MVVSGGTSRLFREEQAGCFGGNKPVVSGETSRLFRGKQVACFGRNRPHVETCGYRPEGLAVISY
jgi:hypothetical protein